MLLSPLCLFVWGGGFVFLFAFLSRASVIVTSGINYGSAVLLGTVRVWESHGPGEGEAGHGGGPGRDSSPGDITGGCWGWGHRRDELWGFITTAVGGFAVVKVPPLKLSCINCWII